MKPHTHARNILPSSDYIALKTLHRSTNFLFLIFTSISILCNSILVKYVSLQNRDFQTFLHHYVSENLDVQ